MKIMQDSDVEACPFCGETTALSVGEVALDDPWFMVFCQSCGSEGPQSDSYEKALANWNQRLEPGELANYPGPDLLS